MRMYDLIDENNVLFDKQSIKRYNSRQDLLSNNSNSNANNNNNNNENRRGLFKRSVSFSQLHRKIINITPALPRRGNQDKDLGVSLVSTSAYKKNGVGGPGGRLKKKFSGPDILMERRKSLKGMTR